MALIPCSECGKAVSDRAPTCPSCGAPVAPTLMTKASAALGSGKSRTTAALLGILLGGLGAHKFYLGKTGWGIVYLVFCFTFIPAILGFIEGLNYLLMPDALFQQRYVRPEVTP